MKDLALQAYATQHGTLTFSADQRAQCAEFLRQHKDREVLVEFTVLTSRTQAQRAFYWASVVPFVLQQLENHGWEKMTGLEVNELLKGQFNAKELVNHSTGEVWTVAQSFEAMPPELFSQALERISAWCMEQFGETFPEPLTQTA